MQWLAQLHLANPSDYERPARAPSRFAASAGGGAWTDLVWDSAHDLIHCVNSFAPADSLFSFDPQTDNGGASYAVATAPGQLSLSSGGASMYSAGAQVVRFGLPGFTNATMPSGPARADALAAVHGWPLSVAVSAHPHPPRWMTVSTTADGALGKLFVASFEPSHSAWTLRSACVGGNNCGDPRQQLRSGGRSRPVFLALAGRRHCLWRRRAT